MKSINSKIDELQLFELRKVYPGPYPMSEPETQSIASFFK